MDIEHTMEFILKQQAQFASDMQAMRNEFKDSINEINGVLVQIVNSQERTTSVLEILAQRQLELAEQQKELTEQQKELTEQQKNTDQRLNALMTVVEKHISDHK